MLDLVDEGYDRRRLFGFAEDQRQIGRSFDIGEGSIDDIRDAQIPQRVGDESDSQPGPDEARNGGELPRALGNVRPSHLIDRKLFDFAGLVAGSERGAADVL